MVPVGRAASRYLEPLSASPCQHAAKVAPEHREIFFLLRPLAHPRMRAHLAPNNLQSAKEPFFFPKTQKSASQGKATQLCEQRNQLHYIGFEPYLILT